MSDAKELVFAALGGLGEIGMNAALYGAGVGAGRKWLLVDLGVSFAGPDLPGIDLLMPDIAAIEAHKRNLCGIVITHAHEDHFGALADLWPRLGCPVYMTQFAADLLEARRLSEPNAPRIPVRIIRAGKAFDVGPFGIEPINVAHSIPESLALAIRTPAGLVVHTGDWKIDPAPFLGEKTDEARFRALGAEGVLAVVADSTNVFRDGVSPSETEVAETLAQLIASAPHRVAVTTFASNVARMKAVAVAARAAGREVVIVGRAMDRVNDVARDLAMLEGLPPFRSADSFSRLPRDKIVALLTGSQGEARAALARIASGEHPDVSLAAGDRVIFSSRTIPGNEKPVGAILNNLAKMGVEVITDRSGLVHVSGHPRRGEMSQLLEWLKPKILVPAHGEAMHLTEHVAFAKACGVPEVVRAFNGDVVRLAEGQAGVVDRLNAGTLVKDGDVLEPITAPAVGERRKLSFAGVVSIALAIDDRGELVTDPEIVITGLPDKASDGTDMLELVTEAVEEIFEGLTRNKRRDLDAVRGAVERGVRNAVREAWSKKPVMHVMVLGV